MSVQQTNAKTYKIRILTFAETANGDVAPLSTLGGDKTQLSGPSDDSGFGAGSGIKYDSKGRLIACTNRKDEPRLLTFAPGAHGNVAPISTLVVPGCSSITLDPKDNIYIAFKDSILVYAAGSAGTAQPMRTITGPLTTLSSTTSVSF